jgi:hypothetical protein
MEFNKPVDYTDKTTWFSSTEGTIEYDATNDKFTVDGTGAAMEFYLSKDVVQYYISQGYTSITLTAQNPLWQVGGAGDTWKNFQMIAQTKNPDGSIAEAWGFVNVMPVTSELKTVTIDLLAAANDYTLDVHFYTDKCQTTTLLITGMTFVK